MGCGRATGGEGGLECRDRYETESGGRREAEGKEAETERMSGPGNNFQNYFMGWLYACVRLVRVVEQPAAGKGTLSSLISLGLHTPSWQLFTSPALQPPYLRS
jgi:hypothetical protein